ncbi:hypothetical protein [Pontimicrobium aquaticum]|uniref:Restriction endonuclease n=1 Tax=Pontimicrobium aquaticum TaxID=2565367 RepID=A0A4U0EVH5_9FLAO|nr:hypothetical protein [Pontimicrobium aquaticum]TJY35830.1 hypothetical protein E5167_08135 [Pontimicrobium aquaticum]
MLTPTDTHLLAGILTKLTSPESVEIVLGNMMYDEASERKRDIDISVKYINEHDEEITFVGLHVKDHTRPLGSPEVEQLCLHFKDTPSIQKGGIISASGYTKPGIRKAKYHGIDLYEIKVWNRHSSVLEHMQFPKEFVFEEKKPILTTKPSITYLFDKNLTTELELLLNHKSEVYRENLELIPNTLTVNHLTNNVITNVFNSDNANEKLDAANGQEVDLNMNINFTDSVAIKLGEELLKVNGAQIIFKAKYEILKSDVEFKVLSKIDDDSFDIGAAIMQFSSGNFFCLSTSNMDKSMKLFAIPVSDRVKKKIHELRIK